MAANNFRHALFCAFITLIISYPIIGFNLEAQGINVTLTGADATTIVMVLLAAVIVFLFQMFREQIMGGLKSIPHPLPQSNKEPMAENRRAKIESWVLTGIVVLALFWPFFVSRGAVDLATLVLIYIMLALGLNVVVGLAGLLDLGYVAFYAVGAYTFALLSQYTGISFWLALPIGALLGLSGTPVAGGLSGHRNPRVWRDHPDTPEQLDDADWRPQRHWWHPGSNPVRHGIRAPGEGRGQHLVPRNLRHRLQR
jgi:branched-chain amino acid transport system permease protein